MPSKSLHVYATVVAFATFLLVIAGGLVTSTGSALAVPDWPLAFGHFFPKMTGGVLFEHGHRMIASVVGFLTLILALWVWRKDSRPVVRHLGLWALAAVVAQGLLGGVTVLYRLPPVISVAHACLGQAFFTIVTCLAVLTGSWGQMPFAEHAPGGLKKLQRLSAMTAAFIFLQLAAGATLRHTGKGFHVHLLVAVFVMIHVLLVTRRVFKEHPDRVDLRMLAGVLTALLGVQLLLGYYSWLMGAVVVTTAHVGVGALMLATSVVLTMQSFRRAEVVA